MADSEQHSSAPQVDRSGLPVHRGDVRLAGFTPTTYDWLSACVEDRWGHPAASFTRPTVIPFESAAALYFLLCETDAGEFPGGKWATIQHLESLIDGGFGG